jgi:hypothetical protein
VVTQPLPKIVHRAQLKLAIAQVPVAQRVAHLQVEDKGIVHLGIAPTKSRLERF